MSDLKISAVRAWALDDENIGGVKDMCEATCVKRQLEYLRNDLRELGGTKLQVLAVEALQARIDYLIKQLEHFGEGKKWADLRKK